MIFENKLIAGVFIKRYKRFFVEIKVKNKVIIAHCPNSGSMIGLLKKGNKVWITKSNNEKRKLKYTLQIIEENGFKVGVNTHLTNKIVKEALENKKIKEFSSFTYFKSEQVFGKNTRFDFYLKNKNIKAFLEVKNVTLKRYHNLAEFPDSITSRGTKHLNELIKAYEQGYQSYLLFVIQREDCKKFNIAEDIDHEYAKTFKKAIRKNIKIICYDCKFTSKGIKLNRKIKLQFNNK